MAGPEPCRDPTLRWMEQSVDLACQSLRRASGRDAGRPFPVWRCHWMSKRLRTDPVEAGERSVELFTNILREAGAVALNKAIFGAVPLSQDIDWVVELRRSDSGQERVQEARRLAAGRQPSPPICLPRIDRSLSCASLGSSCFDSTRHEPAPVPWQKLIQPLDSMIVMHAAGRRARPLNPCRQCNQQKPRRHAWGNARRGHLVAYGEATR